MRCAGREAHVMTFEVGAALEESERKVPWHCIVDTNATTIASADVSAITHRDLVDFGSHRVGDM